MSRDRPWQERQHVLRPLSGACYLAKAGRSARTPVRVLVPRIRTSGLGPARVGPLIRLECKVYWDTLRY